MAKWIAAEKVRAQLLQAVVCPNVTGSINERIAQSKRVRVGSFAIVDKPQVARTCIPPGVWFADVTLSFSGVTFVLFGFVSVSGVFASLHSNLLRYCMHVPRQPHAVT